MGKVKRVTKGCQSKACSLPVAKKVSPKKNKARKAPVGRGRVSKYVRNANDTSLSLVSSPCHCNDKDVSRVINMTSISDIDLSSGCRVSPVTPIKRLSSMTKLSQSEIDDIALSLVENPKDSATICRKYGVSRQTVDGWKKGKMRPEIKQRMQQIMRDVRAQSVSMLTSAKIKGIESLISLLGAKTVAVTKDGTEEIADNNTRYKAAKELVSLANQEMSVSGTQLVQETMANVVRELVDAGVLEERVRELAQKDPLKFIEQYVSNQGSATRTAPAAQTNVAIQFADRISERGDMVSALRATPVSLLEN